jgi:hypothetical protein
MITEERFVDRTGWEAGPWDGEPDRVEWRDKRATPILPCLIVRNGRSGNLCGYVGVPPGHPWHGKADSEAYSLDVEVHGGVTYGAACAGHVCHVAQPGESEPWWIGFDCAHSGDISPGRATVLRKVGIHHPDNPYDHYRSIAYVRHEVEFLADQARAAVKP